MLELFLRPAGPRNITTEISPSYGASTTPPDAIELERRTTESARYRALIFSTGQHFSARHFNLLSTAAHLEFFDLVVATVLDRIADALDSATEDEKRDKEVIVRPTSNGHDECHAAKGPLEISDRNKSSLYSWKDMWAMNDRAEVSRKSPWFFSFLFHLRWRVRLLTISRGLSLYFYAGSGTQNCASADLVDRHHAPFNLAPGCGACSSLGPDTVWFRNGEDSAMTDLRKSLPFVPRVYAAHQR